jgi:hypothetical protein
MTVAELKKELEYYDDDMEVGKKVWLHNIRIAAVGLYIG